MNSFLLDSIVSQINQGIVVINREYRIVLFNQFMVTNTGRTAAEVLGKTIFECFPDLPRGWFTKKLDSVFILKSNAFTNWENRSYLFKMAHNRPITGGVDYMRQNCTFLPIRGDSGNVDHVCIVVNDSTEAAIYDARLRQATREIEFLSAHDPLTGLLNRRALDEQIEKEFNRARRHGTTFSLILFDVDFFKGINDVHGHLVGDKVLESIAQLVKANIRSIDLAGRYGGDEFVIVLSGNRMEDTRCFAERLRTSVVERPVIFGQIRILLSISVGATVLRDPAIQKMEDLLNEADQALYVSKTAGRNRVTVFDFHQ